MRVKAMVLPIVLGIVVAMLGRIVYLGPGFRDGPTRPHGVIIHLFLGLVASVLGSLAVVAIAQANVTAGVFLGLGATQFHTLRSIEREYLSSIDRDELVPRGASYVEGMASAFEARDFLVFTTAVIVTLGTMLVGAGIGVVAGLIWIAVSRPFFRGKELAQIATVQTIRFEVKDGVLLLDGTDVHRVEEVDDAVVRSGFAAAVSARDFGGWLALENRGQRQAIRHDFTARFGLAEGRAPFWPLVHLDKANERVLFFSVPEAGDEVQWRSSFDSFPLLETAHRAERTAAVRKRASREPRPSLQ